MSEQPKRARPEWATRSGRLALVLALVGCAVTAASIGSLVDYCDATALHLAFLFVGPASPILLAVALMLAVSSVRGSSRRWQPITAIVLAVLTGLPSLVTLLPIVTIASGGILACNDEDHPNYTPRHP